MTKKNIMFFPLLACLIFYMSLFAGCGNMEVKADISAYADTPITICGLKEENFNITPAQLAQMDCIKQKAVGQSDKAGTVYAVGPTLETFLAFYGKTINDFSKVKFSASDGYIKSFTTEELSEFDYILAIADGDKPLDNTEIPLRIIIPGGDSFNWVRMINKIEFIS